MAMIYQQIIRYVEGRCSEHEAIALWARLLTCPQLLGYLKTARWLGHPG